MPHLVILYSANLDALTNMTTLCRELADAMLTVRDDQGAQVFPTGGTRVLAYPAPHYAIADGGAMGRSVGGDGEYAFMYLNIRMARGRTPSVHQRVGETVLAAVRQRMDPVMAGRHIGLTLQVDEGHEVFDAKHSTLHPIFPKKA